MDWLKLDVLEGLLSGWKVSEEPRRIATVAEVEGAWSEGKSGAGERMKRTPQPTLTQSRLTGSGTLKIQGAPPPQGPKTAAASATQGVRDRSFSEGDSIETFKSPERLQDIMDTSTPELNRKRQRSTEADNGMKEFFLQALKLNKEEIIKSFQVGLGELSKKVEDNSRNIAGNKENISNHGHRIDGHDNDIAKLTQRVQALERGKPKTTGVPRRAVLSEAYLMARRSVRLWPVTGNTEQEIWGNVGEFLHGPLAVPESDMGQDDVEAVLPTGDPPAAGQHQGRSRCEVQEQQGQRHGHESFRQSCKMRRHEW